MKTCTHGFITAIRARVLPSQGTFGDDVAIQNFQVECDGSTIISAVHFPSGSRSAMMTALRRLALSLLLTSSCCLLVFGSAPTPRRRITKTLYLNNGLEWGELGVTELCEDGSFAAYVEAKFEPYSALDVDETALNALILYCVNLATGLPTGHIASTVGEKGELQGMRTCPSGFITAIKARVLESQGTFGDDVAIQNFQIECDRSSVITVIPGEKDTKVPLGEWGEWSACPDGSAICGLQTRYNDVDAIIDDAAISDAIFYCCALNDTLTHTN